MSGGWWVLGMGVGQEPVSSTRGIFRTAAANFLQKAHTHEDLDGVFGQIAMELVHTEFDTIDELTDFLLRMLRTLGIDDSSRNRSLAYVMGDTADWEQMTDAIGVSFEGHGGPNAPHTFKFFNRVDLSAELEAIRKASPDVPDVVELPEETPKHDRDVFMLTRHYMSSKRVLQITQVFCHSQKFHLLVGQPLRAAASKPIPDDVRRATLQQCRMARQQRLLSHEACDFLEAWVEGRWVKPLRLTHYKYLDWRWQDHPDEGHVRDPIEYDGVTGIPNIVSVVVADEEGKALPKGSDMEAESADDKPLCLFVA